MGQEVTSGFSQGTISVAGLKEGLYLVQIKDGVFFRTTKFIVRR